MSVSPSGTPFVYLYGECRCQTENVRDFQRRERFLKCLKENNIITIKNNTKILNCEFRILITLKHNKNIKNFFKKETKFFVK